MPATHRQRFVDDLVPLILESHDHWWPRDLIRLSSVSQSWLRATQKRLYARPTLRSFRACSQLARSLRENASLRELMKGIDIRPFVGSNTGGVLRAGELEDLRFILSLGGLRSVTLGGELAVGAQRFLSMMMKPDDVSELCIDGSLLSIGNSYLCQRRPPSFEWDDTMAAKLCNLRKLRLSNLELDVSFPSIPFITTISDISLNNVDMTNGYLHQLLGDSTSSLRSLDVIAKSAMDFDEHMRLLLGACGTTLESLSYEVRDCRSTEFLFDHESADLPNLSRLSLSGVDFDPVTLEFISRSCRVLKELTVTGRSVSITPDQWVEFLNSGAVAALETFGAPMWTRYLRWNEPAMDMVRKALETRGIRCPSLGVGVPVGLGLKL